METHRIVMTSTFYPPFHMGGDAVHVKYLAEELVRRGHEVHVLHSLDAFDLKSRGHRPKPAPTEVNTHPVETNMGSASAAIAYLTGANRAAERVLRRVVSKVHPEWVHHHNISLLGHEVLGIGKMPKLYTAHDHWLVCPRNDMMYKGKERCTHRDCTTCSFLSGRPPQMWRNGSFSQNIGGIDQAIAPSHYMAGVLMDHLRLGSEVLPNFAPRPVAVEPAECMPHFVFVGVLEKHKGLDLLLQAYAASGVEAELHVLGQGTLEPMVDEYAELTGGKVKKLGFLPRPQLLPEIASALGLVAPSACAENSPLSCIEALSLGVPLVVSHRGGLPELVSGPCGLVTDLTVEGISSALRMFESEPAMRRTMARNARRRYEEVHTPDHYLDDYLRLAGGST